MLAFEVYRPAIARMLGSLVRAGVENVRIVEADAVAGLERLLPARSVDELWMFFPDPWPKPRHHKRRLVTPAFAASGGFSAETGRNVARGDGLLPTMRIGYATFSRPIRASPTSIRTAKRRAGRPGRSASSSSGRWMRAARSSILAIAVSPEATGEASKIRWRLDISYDGTNFSGWAAQAGRRTVQGELETWLARILRLAEHPRLVCAGRTDAGVHARGQVAHVDLDARRSGRRRDSSDPAAQRGAGRGLRGAPDLGCAARIRRTFRGDLATLRLPHQRCERAAGSAVPLSDRPAARRSRSCSA